MDCEACTDRFVDLLYDELDDADAEATRAHLAQCEGCEAAFGRMSAGRELASFMVMEEPPARVLSAVLAAARERAGERASIKPELETVVPAAVREARDDHDRHDDEGSLWSRFMRWLGGLAMGPQVAMAMMLLLMVGIGLWYLPELRRHDPSDVTAIVDPAAGDEVGPSVGLEPAEPLDLQADPRTGRIRPREEIAHTTARRTRPAPSPSPAPAEEVASNAEPATVAARMPTETATVGQAEADDVTNEGAEAQPNVAVAVAEEPTSEALAADESAPADRLALRQGTPSSMGAGSQPSRSAAPAMARAPSAPSPSAPPTRAQAFDLAAASGAEMAAAPAQAPAEQQAQAPASAGATYQRGMQHMQQREYGAAADDFEAVIERPDTDGRQLLPSALHHLAQSERAAGNCTAAIRSYQRLLSRFPSYSDASAARIELADCYRRTGQISQARAALVAASRDARVASRAQRELVRLEAAERAMNRGAAGTARTPDQAAPPSAEPTPASQ